MISKIRLIITVCCLLCIGCMQALAQSSFVKVEDTSLKDQSGNTFVVKGMQMWYASLLSTKGSFENKERLIAELDSLKALGINCIKMLPGAHWVSKSNGFVASSNLSEKDLQGLDLLMVELQRRGMKAILPIGSEENAKKLVLRKNLQSNMLYKDDPTILAWQIDYLVEDDFLQQLGGFIKMLDDNKHVVMANFTPKAKADVRWVGQTFESILSYDCVDWICVSIEPLELGWVNEGTLFDGLSFVYLHMSEWLENFSRIADKMGKPYVIETSYPRDGMFRLPQTKTDARNAFFSYVCTLQKYAIVNNAPTSGIIFDGWGGNAQTDSETWQISDAPTSELLLKDKGLHSIYSSDTRTKEIIKSAF